MKKILLLSPAISSDNLGDEIIMNYIKKFFAKLFAPSFLVETATHVPISHKIESKTNFDYTFIGGSNILNGQVSPFKPLNQNWKLDMFSARYFQPSIMIGVGWNGYNEGYTRYSKNLFKTILSQEFNHSVRDNYTKNKLQGMGINNIINTSCPTMWGLTKKHCKGINTKKADKVIFMLNGYWDLAKYNQAVLNVLTKVYSAVSVWFQGIRDYEILKSLNGFEKVKIINPNIASLDRELEEDNYDIVSFRLHGGIHGINKSRRTIVINIDNRAKEIARDTGLKTIDLEDINKLENLVFSEFETNIKLPEDDIKFFLGQFGIDIDF